MQINDSEFMLEQKYRPQYLKDCILPELDRKTFEGMIKKGKLRHTILVSKTPGTGKTTLAKVLCKEIDAEVLFVNGSECTMDVIKTKFTNFASTKTTRKGGKVIIIDEFDRKQLVESQRLLRGFMESYSHNCSFIITANNIDGIIEPLQSRSTVIEFGVVTEEDRPRMLIEMIKRLIFICEQENVEIDGKEGKKSIASLVQTKFPDFRSCITTLERYMMTGKIDSGMLAIQSHATKDMNELIDALKGKKFTAMRGIVPNLATDYTAFIKRFYERMFVEVDPKSLPLVIEVIGDNNKTYSQCADMEIHITSMMTELMLQVAWK